MIFDPVIPIPWIAGIAVLMAGTAVFHQLRSSGRLSAGRRGFLLLSRLSGVLAIVLLLLQPSREEKVEVPPREKAVIFAIDTSASMAQPHSDGSSRLDAARADLEKAGVMVESDPARRVVTFADTARFSSPGDLRAALPDGPSTRFDTSVTALLRMADQPQPAALFILSDGHDFDLVPPGETARRTRARDLPIYTVPYGTADTARDISVRIANYHPHTFLRQTTRLEAFIRSVGCPHELLKVELLCEGAVVQTMEVDTGNQPFQTIGFNVSHEKAGQYEYAFRIAPVPNERELSNNTARTYLNVISERIRVLEIEGTPFWDSTFLRRSFARNDKFEIDSLVAFTGERVRPIRSNQERKLEDLKAPATVNDLMGYNMVVLGRNVERVIGRDGIFALDSWVKDHGGVVIFSRGQAWDGDLKAGGELEPIHWDTGSARGARMEVTPQAGNVPAFRLLREVAAADQFPEVIAFPASGPPKTLAATFSVAGGQSPAVVYRRYGSGQTLSLGVGNLWRWVFNPKAEYDNNAYDRFWDQLSLWLLANGGVSPLEGFSLRADTANLPLGETIRLRFGVHGQEAPAEAPSVSLSKDDVPLTTLGFTPDETPGAYHADFTPRETGNYRASLTAPDGKVLATQFITFREDMESTETAMDRIYLEELAKASGGRMIDPAEIAGIVEDHLRGSTGQEPLVRRVSLWDRVWILLLICFLLASEWYARRRWGLT